MYHIGTFGRQAVAEMQGFIQACFVWGGGNFPQNLQFPPKNFCHVGNYNLNVEVEK